MLVAQPYMHLPVTNGVATALAVEGSIVTLICTRLMHSLSHADRHQAAEVLIKEGEADLDAEDSMGRTALSHAAKYGSVECMNLLANCHADVFHKDHDGKTPIQIAEGSGNARSDTITQLKRYQQVCGASLACMDTMYTSSYYLQTKCIGLQYDLCLLLCLMSN